VEEVIDMENKLDEKIKRAIEERDRERANLKRLLDEETEKAIEELEKMGMGDFLVLDELKGDKHRCVLLIPDVKGTKTGVTKIKSPWFGDGVSALRWALRTYPEVRPICFVLERRKDSPFVGASEGAGKKR